VQTALTKEKKIRASDLRKEIQGLAAQHHLNLCLECGKCSAVCPMVDIYGEYVHNRCARSIVERLSFDPETLGDEALWYCWACQECTHFCPSGVDFQTFMIAFRRLLVSYGYRDHAHFCAACGDYLMPKRQADALKGKLDETGELLYECPTCKKNRFADAFVKVSAKGNPFLLWK
jgi:heterodisulfide reductase subunit C